MPETHIFETSSKAERTGKLKNVAPAQRFDSRNTNLNRLEKAQRHTAVIATLLFLQLIVASAETLASESANDDFLGKPPKKQTSIQRCESILAQFSIPSPFAPKASLSEKRRMEAVAPSVTQILKSISAQSRHPELQASTPFERQTYRFELQNPIQDFVGANGFTNWPHAGIKDLAVSPSGKLLALTRLEQDANGYTRSNKYILLTELDGFGRPQIHSSIQAPEGLAIESSEFSIIDNAPVFRVHFVDDLSQRKTLSIYDQGHRQNIRFYSENPNENSTSLAELMKQKIRRVLSLNDNFFFVETEFDKEENLFRYQLVKVRSLKTAPEIIFQSPPFSNDKKNAEGFSAAYKSAFATVNSMRDTKNISVIESSDEIILATNSEFVSFLKEDGTPVGLKSLSHQTQNLDETPMVWNRKEVPIRSQYFENNHYTKITLNLPNEQSDAKDEINFQISGRMAPKFYLTKSALIGQSLGNLQKGLVVFPLKKETPNARQLTDSGLFPAHWQVINDTLYALVPAKSNNKPQLILRIIPLK